MLRAIPDAQGFAKMLLDATQAMQLDMIAEKAAPQPVVEGLPA
jgi:hypothetical protein